MTEKATIFQNVQAGLETVHGTPVDADLKLLALSFDFQPKGESTPFRANGNKYASFHTLNKEWSEFALSGKLTYNEILYPLASLLGTPTPVQQASTAAYLWTFGSNTSAPDDGPSMTIEQGDGTTAWRAAGVQVAGLNFTFNRNEASLSGSAIGEPMETGITLTASPTALTPLPILPGHLKFYMADTRAGLAGATALTRGYAMTFGDTDKYGLSWPVGQDPFGIEREPKLSGSLRLASDIVGMGLIATMRANSTKWFRIKAIGPLIASTYYQTFQLDFPAQITDPGGFGDEDGAHVFTYNLGGLHDATWGKSFEIAVTTDVTTL